MFNRTLQRPMFRIGGSAGTGITSGLTRPRKGYKAGSSFWDFFPGDFNKKWAIEEAKKNKNNNVVVEKENIEEGADNMPARSLVAPTYPQDDLMSYNEHTDTDMRDLVSSARNTSENTGNNNTGGSIGNTDKMIPSFVSELDKANPYPESKPYPYKGSDFFMGLGANILAQPGGQPIFQTIGKAAKGPIEQLSKTQQGDWALKQQDKLGKWKANRELLLTAWKNLDKEKKTSMMRDAEYYVKEGVFPDVGTALEAMLFRKDKRPEVYKRDWIDNRAEELRKKDFEGEALGAQGAHQVALLEWDILRGNIDPKIKSKLDQEQKYVEPDRRTYSDDGKSFTLNELEPDTYEPGYVYFNLDDQQWYTFNGTNFTLYDDETEEIKINQ